MSDLPFYQYAFAQSDCRVREIGPGVDSRFPVERIDEGSIAAVVSRVGWDRFNSERLHGKTAEDIRWLGVVLPLRLGTVFCTQDSLRAILTRHRPTVADFLRRFCGRQEWSVKLYWRKRALETMAGHAGLPSPHYLVATQTATDGPTQTKTRLDGHRELCAAVQQTLLTVERRLSAKAEHCRRIRASSGAWNDRKEEMVFNAVFLLSSSAQENWLEAIQRVRQEIAPQNLLLEASGPWPPYHFCPSLEF
jgi:hypothetical protein